MNIIIQDTESLELSTFEDVEKIIPSGLSGKALNYGQGEGQFQIEDTVWGIYIRSNNTYLLQYEEGLKNWNELQEIVNLIHKSINAAFGVNCTLRVEGKLENNQPHEKYT